VSPPVDRDEAWLDGIRRPADHGAEPTPDGVDRNASALLIAREV
jgi:hypothetical protein